jgi:lambda repressor-like predicted transcriptional regulator
MALRPETELARVVARIETDLARRDELICVLSTDGWSLAQVAAITGLSRAGVADILRRTNERTAS